MEKYLQAVRRLETELFHPAWSLESLNNEVTNPYAVFLVYKEDSAKGNIFRVDENILQKQANADSEIINKSETIIGYLIAHFFYEEQIAEIYRIGVAQKIQGQGIGVQLLNALEKIMMNWDYNSVQIGTNPQNSEIVFSQLQMNSLKIQLEVASDNQKAQRLYQKAGFIKIGCRKKYYTNQADALLMEKIIGKINIFQENNK